VRAGQISTAIIAPDRANGSRECAPVGSFGLRILTGKTTTSFGKGKAGGERSPLAFHVCDWLVPTKDLLNDRGMMGDGVIDIKSVRTAVEAQGSAGYSEIEIFSNDWWGRPMEEVLRTCIERHRTVV
jgi:hypothetical protein